MKPLSRVQLYRATHALFISLWQNGIPTAEIAYLLNLSKAQLAKHLAEVVEADLERPKPAYDVILVEELPRGVAKMLSASAPLIKVETSGDGLILRPYDPDEDTEDKGVQGANSITENGSTLVELEVSAEGQD